MQLQTLNVDLGSRSYPIVIGSGLLSRPEIMGTYVPGRDLLLVSNVSVGPLYAPAVRAGLFDRRIVEALLPDGEAHKSLNQVARILDVLVANRFGRDCCVLALGGGVVGDMAGFAAACYQRGVRFVQIPTTLLAQVDSSVGGKTGVNHPGGKNLIGAFHQPVAVLADTDTLGTLPPRELRAGLAEIIKYGLICDPDLFRWLEEHIERLLDGDPDSMAHVIRRSCEIKAQIVGRDEHERGDRALLNLGHTFGHALESATGYRRWLHGEAVAAGLAMAARMSVECGLLAVSDEVRVLRVLERAGLPTRGIGVAPAAVREHMRLDKKVTGGRIRLVLMRGIGAAFVTAEYSEAALERTLELCCGVEP